MGSSKFRVVLIEEGLGNFGDLFYYTREALEGAAAYGLFEGAKCYADHPDAIMERARPERSVRDIIGHFERVHVEDGATGEALLVADLVLLDSDANKWAIELVESAVGYSGKFGKDFVGLSINASGEAEQIAIAEFLKSGTVPKSALPKLQKAMELGSDQMALCTQLTEAVSCDLVTEAGAKGRVLKMVEGARLTMAKSAAKKVTTSTTKKTLKETTRRAREDGAEGAPAAKKEGEEADEAGADEGHDDEDQDKALIQKMLKQYVGGDDHSEEAHQAMSQAYQHAKEAGMEGDEAEKAAGYAVKLAMHAAKKNAEADEAEKSEEDGAEAHENADEEDQDKPSANGGASSMSFGKKKESAMVTKLQGKIASLEDRLAKKDRAETLEKAIRESGLSPEGKKKFREAVKDSDSAEAITDKLKIFKEGYATAGGADLYVNPEKTGSGTDEGAGLSFADCVKE